MVWHACFSSWYVYSMDFVVITGTGTARDPRVAQCMWQGDGDLVVEELGQGKDSPPRTWMSLLAAGEAAKQRAEYTISQHKFVHPKTMDEFRPIAGRGDKFRLRSKFIEVSTVL